MKENVLCDFKCDNESFSAFAVYSIKILNVNENVNKDGLKKVERSNSDHLLHCRQPYLETTKTL